LSGDGGEDADNRFAEDAERVDVLLGVTFELHSGIRQAA
jgi:hypothetical protein